MNMPTLPTGITLKNFADDVVFYGPNLTADLFKDILVGIPSEMTAKVIGWIRTGK